MKTKIKMIGAAAMMTAVVSCSQMSPAGTETLTGAQVRLQENNYRVVAAQVSGEDTGFSLFPIAKVITGPLGSLIPGSGSSKIPGELMLKAPSENVALNNLYKKSGAITPGRATQLINIRKESGGLNALIFGRPKVRVTADLIEFVR